MKKIFILFLLLFNQRVFANKIVNIKTINREDYLRVLFETTEKPKYFVKELDASKIEVILPNTILSSPLHKNIDKLGIIKEIVLFTDNGDARFVILSNSDNSLKRYLYTEPSENNKFYTVIIDINKEQQKIANSSLEDILKTIPISEGEKSINDILSQNNVFEIKNVDELLTINNIVDEEDIKSLEKQNNSDFNLDTFINNLTTKETPKKKQKIEKVKESGVEDYFTVVLDAGHGGKDPGAIGKRGLKEKNVNLAFAKEIANELRKNKNIRVYLTRDDDVFVELSDRVKISMGVNADLFISIHADSNKNAKSRGLSMYILDDYGFNERTTKILRSQYTTFDYYRNKNSLIREAKNTNINSSVRFSGKIINNMRNNRVNMIQNPLKRANFAVLISPNYPSLLVELGFLSNYDDEKMLASLEYRKKIAKIMAKSVIDFAGK
jgi:N-acetylmuramoyl-L-alanine amidase